MSTDRPAPARPAPHQRVPWPPERRALQHQQHPRARGGRAQSAVNDALRAPGQPLDPATRTIMEGGFDHDFGRVRVHFDGPADRAACAVGAEAFTVGNDVVFSAGRYSPSTTRGRWLLAHELTHVVQQSRAAPGAGAVLDAGAPQEAEATIAADLLLAGRQAPVALFSDLGVVMCRRAVADSPATAQEELDDLRASWETMTRAVYAQEDAASLVARANTLNSALGTTSSSQLELARAESLLLIHSLLVSQLAAAPVDEKGVPQLKGLPPGTKDIWSVPPFGELAHWREIVAQGQAAPRVAETGPGQRGRRPAARPRLPAPPAEGIVVSENAETEAAGEKLTDGGEIKQAIAAVARYKVGDLREAIKKALPDARSRELSGDLLSKTVRQLSGLTADDSASLSSQVGHIVYIASHIYLLKPDGDIVGEDFAFHRGELSVPPGVYFAFPGAASGGRRAIAQVDGPLTVGYFGDFRVSFPLDSLFVVSDRLASQLEQDFQKGRGFVIVTAPAIWDPLARRGSANYGNIAVALWRAKNYVPEEVWRVLKEMNEDPNQAAADLAVQLSLDAIGKRLPSVGKIMTRYMLLVLADQLGSLAAIAVYARTNDELDLAAHGVARWFAEQAVQQVLISGIHLGVKRVKQSLGLPVGAEVPVPKGKEPPAPNGKEAPAAKGKARLKVPPPRPELDAEQGVELLKAGGWKKYVEALGPESPEAKHVEAQRDGLVAWLRAALGAEENEIVRTGTRRSIADLDINFFGPKAVERLYRARQLLLERFGWYPEALELMFDMSLLVDSARAHIYTDRRLSRAARVRLNRHVESGARFRYLEALATRARESTLARAELERAAREWGIDPSSVKAKPPLTAHEFQEHLEAIEEMYKAFDENPSEDLARHIVDAQIDLNLRSEGAYYEPSSIRERASRETGRAGGRLSLGEALGDMLNQRAEFFGRIAKAEKALAKLGADLNAANTPEARFQVLREAAQAYQLSKYSWRFLEIAERAGLPVDPDLKLVAERIKTAKSVDGILLGPDELAGYVAKLDQLQVELLRVMDKKLQNPDRTVADLVFDLRQRVWPLVNAVDTLSGFLVQNSRELDGILVHNAARVIVLQGRADRAAKSGTDGSEPAAGGTIQRKAASPGSSRADNAPPIVAEVLESPGQALDPGTRQWMESGIGHDFSQVRVHADAPAVESARAVDALAYSVGDHVVFGAGRYAPGTPEGRQLLAHELTHVWQQSQDPGHDAGAVPGGLQAKRADGPETPPEKAADAVANHLARRARRGKQPPPEQEELNGPTPSRLIPYAEALKTGRILSEDTSFIPLGLRYALASKPLEGLVVPDEGTLEEQRRRNNAARRLARFLHDAWADPPRIEGPEYTYEQRIQAAPDALARLLAQVGDDRRAVLGQFRSLYGVTLRRYLIDNQFSTDIPSRKILVRALSYLELGTDTNEVADMGLALIPLGTRDEAIVAIIQRIGVGARPDFAKRYARTFSGIGLTAHDTLEEHLRDDLSEYWSGWRLQMALAVLDHNLHPAEQLYFNAKQGRGGDVVKQVQDTWRQGFEAFRKLEDEWIFYVNNGGRWTRDAWTGDDIGLALFNELVTFGTNENWQLVRAVISAYRDTSIATSNFNIARLDAAKALREAGNPSAFAPDAELPIDDQEFIRLRALEQSLQAASGTFFTGTNTAQVESALTDIAKIWAARIQRARASGDPAALARAEAEWERAQKRLSKRLGSFVAGRGDIPLYSSDAQRARLFLLLKRTPADDVYADKVVREWDKCVDDVTNIWAAGKIEQYRVDAATPVVGPDGSVVRPAFDPDYVIPPQSGRTDSHNRIVTLTDPDTSDIKRGADRIDVEVSVANSDGDLADLHKFLTTKGVDNQRRAEIIVQYVDDYLPPAKPGKSIYDRFLAKLVEASNEPRAAGGEGPNLLRIRYLLTPTTSRKERVDRDARVEAASNTGYLSKAGNYLVEVYSDITREDYGEIKRESFNRLKYVDESSDAELEVLLSLTGAKDRAALFQVEEDAFLASVENFKAIKKAAALAAAGIVEVLIETALSALLGGAGIAAVFNTIAANLANVYTQELLLGADFEATSEENVRGVIQAGVGSFLFDVNDYRGKIAAIVNVDKTKFLQNIGARYGSDVAKRSGSLTQNVLAGLADNTVKSVVNIAVDSVLEPRLPTADAMAAESYKFFFNTLGRALHGPALTYRVNPAVIHDFQIFAERYRDTFIFKTGVKLTEGVTKKVAELAASDTSNMSWEEIFENLGYSIIKGTAANLTKSLGSTVSGARLATNRIALVRRLFEADQKTGKLIAAAVARDPAYFAKYRNYVELVAAFGGTQVTPEEWLLGQVVPAEAARLHSAQLKEAEQRFGRAPQTAFSALYFDSDR